VREYISTAREAQATEPPRSRRTGRTASEASLRTDLEPAKQHNRRLRGEVDRLKGALREQLGTQLEAASTASLRQRIDELIEANNRYRSENMRLATELDEVRAQLRIVEDDLVATRASIRRRSANRQPRLLLRPQWRECSRITSSSSASCTQYIPSPVM
jgi:chromosome segregation ATPase